MKNNMFNPNSPLFADIVEKEIPKGIDLEKQDVTIDPAEAIEQLERRVFELEVENHNLKEKDIRPWCFDERQPIWTKAGITKDGAMELEKVAKHYVSKTNSNLWAMMAHCWAAPIPTREKMVLFFFCMFHGKSAINKF